LGFLLAPSASSYTIISDSNLFYSFFEKPKNVIEFKKLKDGTSVAKISEAFQVNTIYKPKLNCFLAGKSEYIRFGEFEGIAVRSNAFSDDWSFMVVNPTRPQTSCEAVIWFDQGISSGNYKIMVNAASGQSRPFVLFTNKGFFGIVPDSPQETVFVFDKFSAVFSFETDFDKSSSDLDSEESFIAQSETTK
jgi:hypothetical protein